MTTAENPINVARKVMIIRLNGVEMYQRPNFDA